MPKIAIMGERQWCDVERRHHVVDVEMAVDCDSHDSAVLVE